MPRHPDSPKIYSENMTPDEIWPYFEKAQMVHLAKIDGDQPRVRIMTLITHKKKLWTLTHTQWDKISQIKKNSKIEFTASIHGTKGVGILRTTGRAIIVEDLIEKKEIAGIIPWFSEYWDSHKDPSFALIRLETTLVLFDNPEDSKKYTAKF